MDVTWFCWGCSFVAKFSKWLLYAKRINFRCLGNNFFMFTKKLSYSMNDFYMFNEWFPLSENDFYTFNKWFLYSAIDFYIQQEICVFSNLKFVFSNMRFLLNNLTFAFNEMKFIKQKPYTFRCQIYMQQNIQSKAFGRTEDLVCKLYIQSASIFLALFEPSLHITEMMFKDEVLCSFLLSYWSMNVCQELGLG